MLLSHAKKPKKTQVICEVTDAEAQYAVRLCDHPFLSSTDATKYRSVLREVSKVFTTRPVKLVVSGTGVTMDDLCDSMASGVSKHDTVGLYHNLGMFDTWPTLSSFLERYLPDGSIGITILALPANPYPGISYGLVS